MSSDGVCISPSLWSAIACSLAHLTLCPPRSAALRKLERSSCIRSSESAAMMGMRWPRRLRWAVSGAPAAGLGSASQSRAAAASRPSRWARRGRPNRTRRPHRPRPRAYRVAARRPHSPRCPRLCSAWSGACPRQGPGVPRFKPIVAHQLRSCSDSVTDSSQADTAPCRSAFEDSSARWGARCGDSRYAPDGARRSKRAADERRDSI
eukprot:scaffold47493_cov63-Phaeocystis_antarctica.AAC.3